MPRSVAHGKFGRVGELNVEYYPSGNMLGKFLASDAAVQMIIGPLGSGKTLGTIMKILKLMMEIPPQKDGVRRSRWVAVRNTYGELKTTTMKDWLQVVPPTVAHVNNNAPMEQKLRFDLADGSSMDAEIIFLSLDRDEDVKKLRGIQATGVWLNEVSEIPLSIVAMARGRCRFPSRSTMSVKNEAMVWRGVIGDTNSPDEEHWLKKAYDEPPDDWAVFRQPGGIIADGRGGWYPNLKAENLQHLPENYYENLMSGATKDYISVFLANDWGIYIDGRACIPGFSDQTHSCPDRDMNPDLPVYIGLDFGLSPAAVFLQQEETAHGLVWYVFHEICPEEDLGATRLAEEYLKPAITRLCQPEQEVHIFGDPSGSNRSQADDSMTVFLALSNAGIDASPSFTNDWSARVNAVARPLGRLIGGDTPGLQICKRCIMLRQGLAGKYRYRKIQGSRRDGDIYSLAPLKNRWSHVCEALQYALIGGGELDDTPQDTLKAERLNEWTPGWYEAPDNNPNAWMA